MNGWGFRTFSNVNILSRRVDLDTLSAATQVTGVAHKGSFPPCHGWMDGWMDGWMMFYVLFNREDYIKTCLLGHIQCCHTGYGSRTQRLLPTPSHYTDKEPSSPSTVPVLPGVLAGKLLHCPFLVFGGTRPRIEPHTCRPRGERITPVPPGSVPGTEPSSPGTVAIMVEVLTGKLPPATCDSAQD